MVDFYSFLFKFFSILFFFYFYLCAVCGRTNLRAMRFSGCDSLKNMSHAWLIVSFFLLCFFFCPASLNGWNAHTFSVVERLVLSVVRVVQGCFDPSQMLFIVSKCMNASTSSFGICLKIIGIWRC